MSKSNFGEAGKTGLKAFDQVQDLTMVFVPGRATSAVHNAMVADCEVDRDGTTLRRWSLSSTWPVKFVAGD